MALIVWWCGASMFYNCLEIMFVTSELVVSASWAARKIEHSVILAQFFREP
jgi:hypothetical protein